MKQQDLGHQSRSARTMMGRQFVVLLLINAASTAFAAKVHLIDAHVGSDSAAHHGKATWVQKGENWINNVEDSLSAMVHKQFMGLSMNQTLHKASTHLPLHPALAPKAKQKHYSKQSHPLSLMTNGKGNVIDDTEGDDDIKDIEVIAEDAEKAADADADAIEKAESAKAVQVVSADTKVDGDPSDTKTEVEDAKDSKTTKDAPNYQENIAKSLETAVGQTERRVEEAIGAKKPLYEEPKKVMGVALNGKDDLRALNTSIIVGILGGAILFAIFGVLRHLLPLVYHRRCEEISDISDEDANPEAAMPSNRSDTSVDETDSWATLMLNTAHLSYVDWFHKVTTMTQDEEVQQSGLDGWALLEFCRLNCRILSVVGPVLWLTVMPLHYSASSAVYKNLDFLSRFDIGNLPHETVALYLHSGMVWFVVLVCSFQMHTAQDHFTQRRHQWLKEIPEPRSTTVLVRNIPHMYRSDRALKEYFVNVFSEEAVARAYVVRKTGRLPKQVERLQTVRYNLALARRSWEQAGCPGRNSPEGLELARCKHRRDQLAKEVAQAQARIAASVARGESIACSSNGFVTFSSELAQRLASREQYTREVTEFKMLTPPDPDDVIYTNLAEDEINSATWRWVGMLCLFGVFVFWIPVVVLISSWTTFSSIQGSTPFIRELLARHETIKSMLSGVLATIALKVFMAFLPSVLHYIIATFLFVKAKASIQLRLQGWYSWFLVVFVLLVTSLGRGLTITMVIIAQEPAKIISLLASSLPSASHFYYNYVILGVFALALELCRVANLCKFLFFHKVLGFDKDEAKTYSEPEDEASYGMGTRMSICVLMSAMTFTFCSCSPLIMIFTWIYFSTAQVTYGYLLNFAESKKADTGGMFWKQALNMLFYVLILYVMLMTGVVRMLTKDNSWIGPPVISFSSLSCLYWAKLRIDNLAFDVLPLEEVVKAQREKAEKNAGKDSDVGFYLQPECDPKVLLEHD
eukprot:TRINITY_DN108822_c0_g1_i1.p1 TRINITY_DN108822_c0_g1~~TRINITY_DN108822_c0_g1_i1.p1  ORF type:complete len:975 (-),score=206.11 TRINITY_DN108822_c0_g1_i1:195-3119(-)